MYYKCCLLTTFNKNLANGLKRFYIVNHFQQGKFHCPLRMRRKRILKERVEGRRGFAWFRLHVVWLSCQIIFWWLLTEIAASDNDHIILLCRFLLILNCDQVTITHTFLCINWWPCFIFFISLNTARCGRVTS